jgi:hypothetical protein
VKLIVSYFIVMLEQHTSTGPSLIYGTSMLSRLDVSHATRMLPEILFLAMQQNHLDIFNRLKTVWLRS